MLGKQPRTSARAGSIGLGERTRFCPSFTIKVPEMSINRALKSTPHSQPLPRAGLESLWWNAVKVRMRDLARVKNGKGGVRIYFSKGVGKRFELAEIRLVSSPQKHAGKNRIVSRSSKVRIPYAVNGPNQDLPLHPLRRCL